MSRNAWRWNGRPRAAMRVALALGAALLLAGCGEGDPGAIGPTGVDGALSPEGQRQEYVEGVMAALSTLGQATGGDAFAKAVDTGNKRQLQTASLAWRQGGAQLKQLSPPEAAAEGHRALLAAVEALDAWNQRITAAAPNKKNAQRIARQASASPASQQFESAVCALVDEGYDVVDPDACGTPLESAQPPVG